MTEGSAQFLGFMDSTPLCLSMYIELYISVMSSAVFLEISQWISFFRKSVFKD